MGIKDKAIGITLYSLWIVGKECKLDEFGNPNVSDMSNILQFTQACPFPSKILEIMAPLWFKGKYYSNSYNFRKVLEIADTQSSMYNYAIDKMVEWGIIKEIKHRVYELENKLFLVPNKTAKKFIKVDYKKTRI